MNRGKAVKVAQQEVAEPGDGPTLFTFSRAVGLTSDKRTLHGEKIQASANSCLRGPGSVSGGGRDDWRT